MGVPGLWSMFVNTISKPDGKSTIDTYYTFFVVFRYNFGKVVIKRYIISAIPHFMHV